jgi:tRNA threonylcarbamoyladenosine biosynthesis protein TsaB
MREVYYAALEKHAAGWEEVVPAQCVAPDMVRPQGAGWVGAGNGFAVYGNMGLDKVLPEVHPTAIAVARLAAPRLAAGEGVDAALAAPIYVREKVAFTQAELTGRERTRR